MSAKNNEMKIFTMKAKSETIKDLKIMAVKKGLTFQQYTNNVLDKHIKKIMKQTGGQEKE
jgi:predicted DNA binding CopG/RHH family protein